MHHSDRGVQYASKDSVALLEAHQLPISMFESHMTESILDHYRSRLEQACPMRRIGAPSDMAGVVIYLSSRAGAYVNGVVIPVDGGICVA